MSDTPADGAPPHVTAGVQRTALVTGDTAQDVRVDRFRYRPGSHTHWHLHTGEQILYGESGRGWVQFDGADRESLVPGGVVRVAVGRRHWHGATPDSPLVHLAVTAGGDTVWLGEVSATDYLGDPPAAGQDAAPGAGDVVSAFIGALERQDLDAAIALLTPDIQYDNVPMGVVTGPVAVRRALAPVVRAQRVEWVVRNQVVANDVVMNERVDRFLVGGRWIELPIAGLFVLREGRIALWRDYFDLASYRAQQQAD